MELPLLYQLDDLVLLSTIAIKLKHEDSQLLECSLHCLLMMGVQVIEILRWVNFGNGLGSSHRP